MRMIIFDAAGVETVRFPAADRTGILNPAGGSDRFHAPKNSFLACLMLS